MSVDPGEAEVRPYRWSRDEIKLRPLLPLYVLIAAFFLARLSPGLRLPVAAGGIGLTLLFMAIAEFHARTEVLARSGREIVLRRRWHSPLLVGMGGEHRVLRLPAPGGASITAGLLWIDGYGRRIWLTEGGVWPLDDVEALALDAGVTIEDGVPADITRDRAP